MNFLAGVLTGIKGEAHAADLGIATIASGEASGVVEDCQQASGIRVEHHQLVIEAQGVLHFQLGDGADGLDAGFSRANFGAIGTNAAHRGPNAATIF